MVMGAGLKTLYRGQKNQQVRRNRRPCKRTSENGPQQGHMTPCCRCRVLKSLRYDALKIFICICLNAKSHNQNDRARKKPEEPKDHYCGRTFQMGSEDENPLPVDVDSDSEVPKKGSKGVNWTNQIMSESDSDVAITKNIRKESRPRPRLIIISDKVWF